MTTDQLPGLPQLPKKRGRSATGKAKSAAERKAKQRKRIIEMLTLGAYLDELDVWLERASPAQICEAFPTILRERPTFAVDCAARLQAIARDAC